MPDHPIPSNLPGWPRPKVRTLLEHDVGREFEAYRNRQQTGNILWLDVPSLRTAIAAGSVRPSARDLPMPEITESFAYRAAAEALADGVVLMFIDGVRVSDPDATVNLHAESRVRYLRLHAQRGI